MPGTRTADDQFEVNFGENEKIKAEAALDISGSVDGENKMKFPAFDEDSGISPYENKPLWFLFSCQKFKPVGFIEYGTLSGIVCHKVISIGLV